MQPKSPARPRARARAQSSSDVAERLERLERQLAGPRLPELLTVQDLATFLKTTPNAVRLMHGRGQLPAPVRIGDSRRLLWRTDDVSQWLDRTESRLESSRSR